MRYLKATNVLFLFFLILAPFTAIKAAAISDQGIFIENYDGSLHTSFGAKILDDFGDPILGLTDVMASDGVTTYNIGPDGNWYWMWTPYGSITGALNIYVPSLGISADTHVLDKLDVVPLAQNIQYSINGGHTITWDQVTFPPGSEWDNGDGTYSSIAHRYSLRFYNHTGSEILRSGILDGNVLSYTIPIHSLLTEGDLYTVRLISRMYDYEGEDANGENGTWFLESRSSAFMDFTATAVPVPSALSLMSFGLLGLACIRRKNRN